MTSSLRSMPDRVRCLALPVPASSLSEWIESGDPETIAETWQRLASGTPSSNPADPSRFHATIRALEGNATPIVTAIGGPGRPHAMIAARSSREPLAAGRPPVRWRFPVRLRAADVVVGGMLHDGSQRAVADVARAVVELASPKNADVVRVHQVLLDGPEHTELKGAAQKSGRRVHRLRLDRCWEMDLARPPASTLTSKRRGQLRRESRRLEEAFDGDVNLVELRQPAEVPTAIAWASALDAGTYKQRFQIAMQDCHATRTLLSESADSGRWRSWFLLARGRPIAYVMGEERNGTFFLDRLGYAHSHAALSPGKTALVRVATMLHEQGVERLDFGLGDAEYKRVLGTRSRDVVTLLIYGGRIRARVALAASAVERLASRAIKQSARRWGFDGRLRARWRGASNRGTKP